MRRSVFYLAVWLAAFGIGCLFGTELYPKNENVSNELPQKIEANIFSRNFSDLRAELKRVAPKSEPLNSHLDKKKNHFICEDKIISSVFAGLKKEKEFKDELKYFLEYGNPSNCHDILFIEKSVDLNRDGKKEIVVRGRSGFMCGATGNCATWIYEKNGNKYEKLLNTGGKSLEVIQNSTNGYQDILVKVRASCCTSYLSTYKFNGKKYTESGCLFEDYGTTGSRSLMTCEEKAKQSQHASN